MRGTYSTSTPLTPSLAALAAQVLAYEIPRRPRKANEPKNYIELFKKGEHYSKACALANSSARGPTERAARGEQPARSRRRPTRPARGPVSQSVSLRESPVTAEFFAREHTT